MSNENTLNLRRVNLNLWTFPELENPVCQFSAQKVNRQG